MNSKEVQRNGLSISRLRKYKGLEKLSNENARCVVNTIEKLTELLFNFLKNQEIKSYENKSSD